MHRRQCRIVLSLFVGGLLLSPGPGRTQARGGPLGKRPRPPATRRAQDKALAAAEAGPPVGAVRGVFVLSKGTRPLADSVVKHADIHGLALRANWLDMQPAEGEFVWPFDAQIARARKAGKQVSLCVHPGAMSPRWVYEAGAKSFLFADANPHHQGFGKKLEIPIPWDPVFLKKWTAFIRAMGKKYAGDDTVVMVHMIGPNKTGAELHLPNTPADQRNWQKAGYTRDKLVAAYRQVIDAYDAAFPYKCLALDVSNALSNDGAVQQIVAYAHNKLGRRLCVQHDALSAKTKETWWVHRLVRSYRGKATVGFQLLSSVTPMGRFNDDGRRFGGTLGQAFGIGLRAGATYLEIYPADLKTDQPARDIHALAVTLANNPQKKRAEEP